MGRYKKNRDSTEEVGDVTAKKKKQTIQKKGFPNAPGLYILPLIKTVCYSELTSRNLPNGSMERGDEDEEDEVNEEAVILHPLEPVRVPEHYPVNLPPQSFNPITYAHPLIPGTTTSHYTHDPYAHFNHVAQNVDYKNIMTQYGPPPSVYNGSGSSTQLTLLQKLNTCIKNGTFDILNAGIALHEAYCSSSKSIQTDCVEFAKKHRRASLEILMPAVQTYFSPNTTLFLANGNMIFSMMSAITSTPPTQCVKDGEKEYKCLIGAIFRTRNLNFRYPDRQPFNGESIFLEERPGDKKNEETRVILKRLLFQLLERSCKEPREIQTVSWRLPFDNDYKNNIPFPEDLYNDLRTFFLYYFGIEESSLESGLWDDSFANLSYLDQWDTINAKKKRYRFLSLARYEYMSRDGFHSSLKEALKEIQRAQYSPPSNGQKYGIWSYRDRNAKRKQSARVSESPG